MDAEAARIRGAVFYIAAETWSEVAQSLQDRAARVAQERGEPIKGVLELMDETVRMGEIRGAARDVVDSVNEACNGPLDTATLAQSEDDFASGRFQKGKGVMARFWSRKSP